MYLDVNSINSVENILLGDVTNGFSLLTVYAKHLLYYFIAFEIILSGLGWALYQSQYAERLFFQLIKIGLILFIVENYTFLLNSILSSALIIGQQLSQHQIEKILLNPGLIWQYGYNFSVSLLQFAATADGFSLPLIFTILGMGILLVVGLFGIQILIQVLAFYFVSAMALLVLPLSVFSPLRDFFSQSIKSILQAAIRLMVQMLIVSAAVSVWSVMRLQSFSADAMNLNVPLGFLFTGLIFVFASYYLPKLAERVVGNIQWQNAPIISQSTSVNSATSGVHATPVSVTNTGTAAQAALTAGLTANAQNAMLAQPAAAMPGYTQAIKEDFLARKSDAKQFSGIAMQNKFAYEQQRLEDVKKIKQAFYEIVNELKSNPENK